MVKYRFAWWISKHKEFKVLFWLIVAGERCCLIRYIALMNLGKTRSFVPFYLFLCLNRTKSSHIFKIFARFPFLFLYKISIKTPSLTWLLSPKLLGPRFFKMRVRRPFIAEP